MSFTTLAPILQGMTFFEWLMTIITLIIISLIPFITKYIVEFFHGPVCSSRMLLLIKKEVKRESDISRLRKEKLAAEMSCADKTMIIIKSMMMRQYKTRCVIGRDLRYYSKILDSTLAQVKNNTLLKYVKKNGFEEYHGNDWTFYKERTTKILQSEHVSVLDDEYYSDDFTLSRKVLLELNDPIMNKIRDEIYRMFNDMKVTALRHIEKIKIVEEQE